MEFYGCQKLYGNRGGFVSIPNGMEFYAAGDFDLERSSDGFNSQRDGILLNINQKSILEGKRFNSQRDGILPLQGYF